MERLYAMCKKQAIQIAKDRYGWRPEYSFLPVSRVWKVSNPQSSIYQCKNLCQSHRLQCEFTLLIQVWTRDALQQGRYVEVNRPNDMEELCNQVMNGKLFGFLQVDIHVPDELIDKFSKFCLLLVIGSIPNKSIPSHMKEYQTKTWQKMIHGTKKLLEVTHTKKILLYSPMLKLSKPWAENNSYL